MMIKKFAVHKLLYSQFVAFFIKNFSNIFYLVKTILSKFSNGHTSSKQNVILFPHFLNPNEQYFLQSTSITPSITHEQITCPTDNSKSHNRIEIYKLDIAHRISKAVIKFVLRPLFSSSFSNNCQSDMTEQFINL